MSAVSDCLFFAAVFQEFGVPVEFEPGWEIRGNGQTAAYQGLILHHTAIPASYENPGPGTRVLRDGRPDLDGPLCQMQGKFNGAVRFIAAHPANHAGASGGRSMGPLPTTNAFNRLVMGLEMDYAGNAPMSPEQYKIAKVAAIATKRLWGTVERARLHFETSIEGKWDAGWKPGTPIDANAWRANALALEAAGGDGDTMSAAGEALIIEQNKQILNQLTGSREVNQFPGWPHQRFGASVDTPKAFTLVDYIRGLDAKLMSNFDLSNRPGDLVPDDAVGHVLTLHALLLRILDEGLGGGPVIVELTPEQASALDTHVAAILTSRLDELAAELGTTEDKLVRALQRLVLTPSLKALPGAKV